MLKLFFIFLFILFSLSFLANNCIECHIIKQEQIVIDWEISEHTKNNMEYSTYYGDADNCADNAYLSEIPAPVVWAECHETKFEKLAKGKHATA